MSKTRTSGLESVGHQWFYVDDPNDLSAAAQREWAYQVLRDEPDLFVPLTVVLKLEWVLRTFYDFGREEVVQVIQHLLGLRNVTLEDWPRIADALEWHGQGLDFADALHLAGSAACELLFSFDDRRFARRAVRLGLRPKVVVPGA